MTKKFLALTMVLVLAAGFAAVAQDRPLEGSWENELTFVPQTNPIDSFTSTLDVTYNSGGITYNSISEFDLGGFDDQEFGVSTSVGLLDLESIINFNPSAPGLDYWLTDAALTLGGVSITDNFLLQDTKAGLDNGYGAGMDLGFSGETPGGVSIEVNNYFGMEPVVYNADTVKWDGEITGRQFGYYSIPGDSGYAIVGRHGPSQTNAYNPSAMQYVATKLTMENKSIGCCDFSSETLFSELNGFEYTEFEFEMVSENLPLSLDGDLKFTPQTKSVVLTPSLTTEWGCFDVYTDLSGTLANNSQTGSTLTGLEVEGFSLTGVELGHVEFSSYTALYDYNVADLNSDFRASYDFVDDEGDEHTEYFDEVIRIDKMDMEGVNLDFVVDTYFDMSESSGLFDLALFELEAAYELSSQFTIDNGLLISPKTKGNGGLEEVSLGLDYSF